jgi:hypothetical protein
LRQLDSSEGHYQMFLATMRPSYTASSAERGLRQSPAR